MLTDKQMSILSKLQENSRRSMSSISRELQMPLTTAISAYKKLQPFIRRHTAMIDFNKLGFEIRVFILIKADRKAELEQYLHSCPNLNCILRVEEYDYGLDLLFQDMKDYYIFLEQLEKFGIEKIDSYDIVQQLRFEEFNLLKQKNI